MAKRQAMAPKCVVDIGDQGFQRAAQNVRDIQTCCPEAAVSFLRLKRRVPNTGFVDASAKTFARHGRQLPAG
eukprot:10099857-Lingulodinium_polyedra.AAC.1